MPSYQTPPGGLPQHPCTCCLLPACHHSQAPHTHTHTTGSPRDRVAVAPLTCRWPTAPAPLCHPLGHVPSTGSRGLFHHGRSIVVAIRGVVVGRGLWDGHGAELEAVAGVWLCQPPLRSCHWLCVGGNGAAKLSARAASASLHARESHRVPPSTIPGAPRGFLAPCPYLGLPRGHSPPRCPWSNTAPSSLSPARGSLAGEGRGVGGDRSGHHGPSPQNGAAVGLGDTRSQGAEPVPQQQDLAPCWSCGAESSPSPFWREPRARGVSTDPSDWAPPGTPGSGDTPAPHRRLRRRPRLCQGLKGWAALSQGPRDHGWHRGHPLPTL